MSKQAMGELVEQCEAMEARWRERWIPRTGGHASITFTPPGLRWLEHSARRWTGGK